jgi:hypothetical protein
MSLKLINLSKPIQNFRTFKHSLLYLLMPILEKELANPAQCEN